MGTAIEPLAATTANTVSTLLDFRNSAKLPNKTIVWPSEGLPTEFTKTPANSYKKPADASSRVWQNFLAVLISLSP